MKVLVVEDSQRLRKSLKKGLSNEGFLTDVAEDGEFGLALALDNEYDVIVLDLMIPKLNGLSVVRALRDRRVKTNILILSAKDQVADRVKGLELGADDYLPKPFAFDELCARIKTLGRRKYSLDSHMIHVGDISIDTSNITVTCQGQGISLTRSEYQILETLSLRRGRVVSKNELYSRVREFGETPGSNVIEAMMSTLRKKLNVSETCPSEIIKTKRGFGYIIE